MAPELTTTQKALLEVLPRDLPAAELKRLVGIVEAYLAKNTEAKTGIYAR